jgi:uncharacterized repeat protein (TIGR03803 family)
VTAVTSIRSDLDSKGNLYGTTSGGGTGTACQCGTVFELSPGSNGGWTETVLHSFSSSASGGSIPFGGLVSDSKGNLYGTTPFGGASFQGTVYELSPGASGTWSESVLYSFTGGTDGGSPYSSRLSVDSAGNLYGRTNSGGAYGFGVIFELIAGSNGTWTEKVLHNFTGDNDGTNPPCQFTHLGRRRQSLWHNRQALRHDLLRRRSLWHGLRTDAWPQRQLE